MKLWHVLAALFFLAFILWVTKPVMDKFYEHFPTTFDGLTPQERNNL